MFYKDLFKSLKIFIARFLDAFAKEQFICYNVSITEFCSKLAFI